MDNKKWTNTLGNSVESNNTDKTKQQKIIDYYKDQIEQRWLKYADYEAGHWSPELENLIHKEIYKHLPEGLKNAIKSKEVKTIHDQEAFTLFKEIVYNETKWKKNWVNERRWHYIGSEWRMSHPQNDSMIVPHAYYLYEINWEKFIIEYQDNQIFLAWWTVNDKKQFKENLKKLKKFWIDSTPPIRNSIIWIDLLPYKYWIPPYFNEKEQQIIKDYQEEEKEKRRKKWYHVE